MPLWYSNWLVMGRVSSGREPLQPVEGSNQKASLSTAPSSAHEAIQFCCCQAAIEETELSLVSYFYFTCSLKKSGHRRSIERGRETDAPDSGRSECSGVKEAKASPPAAPRVAGVRQRSSRFQVEAGGCRSV